MPLRTLYEKIQLGFSVIGGVLREYAYENTGLKLSALLIAIVLWGAVSKREIVQTTLQEVPIEYVNLAAELAIANNDNLKTANVRLRGPKDIIEELRPKALIIKVNLAATKPGERVITLSNADVVAPPNIEILDIDPPRTHLTVERIIEKQVKVVPRFAANLPQDYEVTAVTVNPSTITIKGPESRVNVIADAPTETISLAEHRNSFIERPNIDIKDTRVDIVNQPTIEVQVQIGQIRIERRVANVPVRVPPGSEKITLSPVAVTVELEGPKSVIESVSPGDISALVDVQSVPDSAAASPRIVLPPAVLGIVTVKKVEPEQIQIKRRR